MDEALRQMLEDLEDVASLRMTRFDRAEEAERLLCHVFRKHGEKGLGTAITVFTTWWDEHYPPNHGHGGEANKHTMLAVIESAREFSMGS